MGRHDWTFALRIFGQMFIVYRPSSGATKRKFWEKDLKTTTKHDSKLSEVILKVFWENAGKNSSVPHCQQGLMEEFLASKVHLQPANWRTRKFPCRRMSRQYWPVWVWSQGKIHPFSDIERAKANQLNSGELIKKRYAHKGGSRKFGEGKYFQHSKRLFYLPAAMRYPLYKPRKSKW